MIPLHNESDHRYDLMEIHKSTPVCVIALLCDMTTLYLFLSREHCGVETP